MPPSHLHTYPKTFNRWGHNRAFPFSSPVRLGLLYLFSCGIGLALLVDLFHSFGFENLNNAELLKKDKRQLLVKKRAFDTLILGNKIVSNGEEVRNRSLF